MNQPKTIVGVDVGGTKIHAGLYSADTFVLLESVKILTPVEEGFQEILYQVVQLIQDLRGKDTVAVGVGFPGYVNSKTGVLYRAPNLPLKDPMNVLQYLREHVDLPVAVDNDAKLFTLAEYEQNWKPKVMNMVGLTLGTGLGGGLILDGKLYRGRNGFAGEFGHMSFDYKHEFEDFLSGKSDRDELGVYLGVLLSDIIHLFNPEVVVLGGSVMKDFPKVQKQVWEEIKARTVPESSQGLLIEVSQMENPGSMGAAMIASQYVL
jgi:glucokinase